MPLLILAAKNIPESEPGLNWAILMFIVGDLILYSYYETRGAMKAASLPGGPADKDKK